MLTAGLHYASAQSQGPIPMYSGSHVQALWQLVGICLILFLSAAISSQPVSQQGKHLHPVNVV